MKIGGTKGSSFDERVHKSLVASAKQRVALSEPSIVRATAKALGPRVTHRLLQASKVGDERSWSDVLGLLPAKPGVVSVDVFDTVLTRRISTDSTFARSAAHLAIGKGIWSASVEDYLVLRQERAAEGPAESVRDWFRDLQFSDELVANEAELEQSTVCAVPGAAEALSAIRLAGWKVIFLSDMHHSAIEVRNWLEAFDLVLADEEVVSSSDLGVSKSQGNLFDVIIKAHGEVVHIGNQLWADVAVAGARGIAPLALRKAESNRYERAVEQHSGDFGAVLAGAARRSRLSVHDTLNIESEMAKLGASVVGPVMVGFFAWARQRAFETGHTSMAFLARDGRLPYEVAHALPEDHRSGLNLSYLEGSRRTWQLPAASAMGVDRWIDLGTKDWASFLNHSRTSIPFESLLDRFGLFPSDPLPAQLQNHSPGRSLNESQLPIWDDFIRSAAAKQLIARRSDMARDTLYRYLKATEVAIEPTAFVDIGWRGQMALQMNAVLEGYMDVAPIHLHFGAYKTVEEIEQSVRIERFAIHDDGNQPVDRPVSCLESIAASGGPKLIDLVWTPDGADPVFSEAQPEIFGAAKASLWAGAKETAALLPSMEELASWGIDTQNVEESARQLLRMFWMKPSAAEASAFSTLSFETDDDGRSIEPVAQPYSLGELVKMRTDVARQWQQGSIELAKAPLRPVLRAVTGRKAS